MRALAILTVLPLVLTTPALAQNAQSIQQQPTSPNSGAGIPGQPGGKSGPAVKPSTATTGSGVESGGAAIRMRPKFPDCREARAVQQSSHPPTQPRPRSRRALAPSREGALARHRSGLECSAVTYPSMMSARGD